MPARAGDHAVYFFLFALLCAAPVRADQLPSLAWNCWVGGNVPLKINCIHERSQPLPKNAPEDTDIELEAQLLDQLREKSRNGGAALPDGVEWKRTDILHEGGQWTIRSNVYPEAALLDENGIARVVSSVLCPANIPCAVKVRDSLFKEISVRGE